MEQMNSKEEAITREILETIDDEILLLEKEIKKLEQLKIEKNKLLAKARIVYRSCILLAGSDKVTPDELDKIYFEIFKKYGFTGPGIKTYLFSLKNSSLYAIKNDINKFEISLDFLKDLGAVLPSIAQVDHNVSSEEYDMMEKLYKTFGLMDEEKA